MKTTSNVSTALAGLADGAGWLAAFAGLAGLDQWGIGMGAKKLFEFFSSGSYSIMSGVGSDQGAQGDKSRVVHHPLAQSFTLRVWTWTV